MATPYSAKQVNILKTLAAMLEQPDSRITTAALAQEMGHSEAALYRHYASKAAIFEGLITLLGEQILEDLGHIEITELRGRARLRKQVHALLLFVERHRGAARVLTGGALAGEAPPLQEQVNGLLEQIGHMLAESARLGMSQEELAGGDEAVVAQVLLLYVLGRWLRFAQSRWQAAPTSDLAQQLKLLGL